MRDQAYKVNYTLIDKKYESKIIYARNREEAEEKLHEMFYDGEIHPELTDTEIADVSANEYDDSYLYM